MVFTVPYTSKYGNWKATGLLIRKTIDFSGVKRLCK